MTARATFYSATLIAAFVGVGACDQTARVSGPSRRDENAAPAPSRDPSGGSGGSGLSVPDLGTPGASDAGAPEVGPQQAVSVYAHSGSDLFRVDPTSLMLERVGPFRYGPEDGGGFLNTVTDIAIDRAGKMVGVTFDDLLEIDKNTGICTRIASLPQSRSFNGLSWIRSEMGEETLLGTDNQGGVFRIDPMTGTATLIGDLGDNQQSSGDVVSVARYGTLITLKGRRGEGDILAKLDSATGTAVPIGPVGFEKVWGLGFWGNRVFGFDNTGNFLLINPETGKGELVQSATFAPFWGAGVTTSAPVID